MPHPRPALHVGVVLSWAAIAGLAYLVYLIVAPFLNPLGWAAAIAIVSYPVHARFDRRWGGWRAAALSTAAITVIVIVPLLLVMAAFVSEALGAASGLQQGYVDGRFAWLEPAWRALMQRVPAAQRADVAAFVTDASKRVALVLAGQLGAVVRISASFVFDLVLALFATFFLLRDSSAIVSLIRRTLPADKSTCDRLLTTTRELVSVSITSSGIVAAVQGVLGGLVFAVVGIEAPIFWGVVMAFFCLLPFGAWVVWLPAAVLLAVSGSVGRGLIVAALGFGIVSAVDNVLRPMLLSGRTSMNGLLIFISLLGGMAVFGALGLVLGPLIIATASAVLTTYADAPPRRDD